MAVPFGSDRDIAPQRGIIIRFKRGPALGRRSRLCCVSQQPLLNLQLLAYFTSTATPYF